MAGRKSKRVCSECGSELPGRRWMSICWFCWQRKKEEIRDAVSKKDAEEEVEAAIQPYGGKGSSEERSEQRADEGWHPIVGTGVTWPK